MLALERSDHGFSGESRGGHARRERLPQAGLHGSHRGWATRHSLSGRTASQPMTPMQSACPNAKLSRQNVETPAPLTEWPHAGRDRSPRDHADTRTLLLHLVAGAPLEQIHSGRIRLLLPSNAVVFTGTSGRIVGYSENAAAAAWSVRRAVS